MRISEHKHNPKCKGFDGVFSFSRTKGPIMIKSNTGCLKW